MSNTKYEQRPRHEQDIAEAIGSQANAKSSWNADRISELEGRITTLEGLAKHHLLMIEAHTTMLRILRERS